MWDEVRLLLLFPPPDWNVLDFTTFLLITDAGGSADPPAAAKGLTTDTPARDGVSTMSPSAGD